MVDCLLLVISAGADVVGSPLECGDSFRARDGGQPFADLAGGGRVGVGEAWLVVTRCAVWLAVIPVMLASPVMAGPVMPGR